MEKIITEINNKTLKQALTVDDMGHITRAGQPVKTFEQSGHLAVYLTFTDGTNRNIYVHQLVILAFKGFSFHLHSNFLRSSLSLQARKSLATSPSIT